MSAISAKVRPALFTKLNVSGVTALATNGVHHKVAPEGRDVPFLLFERASNIVLRTFGLTNIGEDDIWIIKSAADEDSSTIKEPERLNEEILIAAETAIGTGLTLSSGETWAVYRLNDIPDYTQTLTDRTIYYQGFLLRVVAT